MGTLLAVVTFLTIVAVIGAIRADDEQVRDFADSPRRLPTPSPRDVHAITGTLDRAPIPSWG